MTIWVDAQLSPALAAWINREFSDIGAKSLRSVGLRDASDSEILFAAREKGATVMSKDADFLKLLDQHGSPPQFIWITCGNTSNRRMREILRITLKRCVEMLHDGEVIVEISDR